MYKLGAIGAGHMGMVIIDCLARSGFAAPEKIMVHDTNPERTAAAAQKGYSIAGHEANVYTNCENVLIAVLPQQMQTVLLDLSECKVPNVPVVMSIVSGISSAYIRKFLGNETPVVCIVPSIGLSVGMGATALSRTENVGDGIFGEIKKTFDMNGETAVVDEPQLKDIIAANGCAPGYAFYFMEAVALAVADRGVDYSLAVKMTAKSFAGAAEMALASGKPLPELLAEVCSPGGLTTQAAKHFNEENVNRIIADGVNKSIRRGYELAK